MNEEVETVLSKAKAWGRKEVREGLPWRKELFLIYEKLAYRCMKKEETVERQELKSD